MLYGKQIKEFPPQKQNNESNPIGSTKEEVIKERQLIIEKIKTREK